MINILYCLHQDCSALQCVDTRHEICKAMSFGESPQNPEVVRVGVCRVTRIQQMKKLPLSNMTSRKLCSYLRDKHCKRLSRIEQRVPVDHLAVQNIDTASAARAHCTRREEVAPPTQHTHTRERL